MSQLRPAAASGGIGFVGRKRFDQFNDPAPDLLVGNPDEGAVELQPFGTGAEFDRKGHRRILGKPLAAGPFLAGKVFKKEADRDSENGGDGLQAARANPIRPFLVFLDLLKGNAKIFTELFLTHSQHISPKPYSAPNMDVSRIWLFLVFLVDHLILADPSRLSVCVFHQKTGREIAVEPATYMLL